MLTERKTRNISIHALRGEGDKTSVRAVDSRAYFNPRPPWGGRPRQGAGHHPQVHISIHALRGEGDRCPLVIPLSARNFNPRPPWGGRPHLSAVFRLSHPNFNPRPPWGGRHQVGSTSAQTMQFQSTPSVGRATPGHFPRCPATSNFNPRPPWGGRRVVVLTPSTSVSFQSTPSVGRATRLSDIKGGNLVISIHALRGEGDVLASAAMLPGCNFNPRPPRGGRPGHTGHKTARTYFNPRPPRGGRRQLKAPAGEQLAISIHALREEGDASHQDAARHRAISIHALREEGDYTSRCHRQHRANFNPRPPRGGRPKACTTEYLRELFQSTPSARRATHCGRCNSPQSWNFNPRPPRGGRPGFVDLSGYVEKISIHALREEGDQ